MNAPRTVVVSTRDHGDITVDEPEWCLGFHPTGYYRVDLSHAGPMVHLGTDTSRGEMVFSMACLEQRPFSEAASGRGVFVAVELDGDWYPSNPAQLDTIAAALVDGAVKLRTLARQLSVITAGGAG
ncbi:MAG: hypothetical protein JWO67_1436 [Streptosporangiaceae bacterium]|nr:hypothetical protein [Streptosporangiaceae bacterium]